MSNEIDLIETYQKHLLNTAGISMDTYKKYEALRMEEDEESIEDGDERDDDMGLKENQLSIMGPIVSDDMAEIYNLFGIKNFTSPRQVKERLSGIDGDVELRINSPGGVITAAAAICNALDEHEGTVTATIEGLAASAATMIMLCADKISINEWATVMIHRSSGVALGNGEEIVSYGDYMQKFDATAAEKYSNRGKKTKEEFFEMMRVETWMTADTAKSVGLVDKILSRKDKKQNSSKAEAPQSDSINKDKDAKFDEMNTRAFEFLALIDE